MSRQFGLGSYHLSQLASHHRREALRGTVGNMSSDFEAIYRDWCGSVFMYCPDEPKQMGVIFTRDEGHHTCGWWKNPDYDRCEHLSLSFRDMDGQSIDPDPVMTRDTINHFYGDHARLVWSEPPYSDEGKKSGVWHYRVFYAPDWKTPLLPRGEVYTKEFTEAGWLSSSANQARIDEEIERLRERLEDQ